MQEHVEKWVSQFTQQVKALFGQRLRFVGLQGSQRRGEATEESDVDLVVILDQVEPEDLAAYRQMLSHLAPSVKPCGFIGGWEDLERWPGHELFQFCGDTVAIYGSLASIASKVTWQDIALAVRLGAAGLYHGVCHSLVYDDQPAMALPGLYKAVFYPLQALHYCRTGEFADTRKALLDRLEGMERRLMEAGICWKELAQWDEEQQQELFECLFDWSRSRLDYGRREEEESFS